MTDTVPGDTYDQDEAWLAWRSQGIGASDIAMAHTGKYGGAYQVAHTKITGHRVDVTPQMQRGHRWEHTIADLVHVATGYYIAGEQMQCEHPEHPHRRCTLDGLCLPTPEGGWDDVAAVLEAKSTDVNVRPPWGYYETQTQYQMHVTGIPRAVIALAVIDDTTDTLVRFEIRTIDADPFIQAELAELADELWAHVQAGTYPDPDTPAALDVVKARHAEAAEGDTVDLTSLADDVARFADLKAAEKAAADERKTIEARIRDAVGRNTRGEANGYRVSISKPREVMTEAGAEALMLAHPEFRIRTVALDKQAAKKAGAYAEFTEPVGARVLKITPPKE